MGSKYPSFETESPPLRSLRASAGAHSVSVEALFDGSGRAVFPEVPSGEYEVTCWAEDGEYATTIRVPEKLVVALTLVVEDAYARHGPGPSVDVASSDSATLRPDDASHRRSRYRPTRWTGSTIHALVNHA